jgi:DNA-binding beta-propeller fold protein YncE
VISRRTFGFSALASFAASCRHKATPGYDVYIANEAGSTIAVVDLTSFAVTRHVALDDSPTAVIAAPERSRVYALAPKSGTVYEIDTGRPAVTRHIKLGPSISMRMSGNSLWVLGSRSLTHIQLDSFRRTSTIGLKLDAHDFDLSNGTDLAAAGYGSSGSVSVIELKNGSVGSPVKVSDAVGPVRFRLDGKGLFAADIADRRLCVLDAEARIIVKLPLAVRPDNLCFNPDGGQLFVTGEGRDAVVVIFPYYVPQIAETVLAGHAPGAMAASATNLFVANPQAGDVTILNINRRKTIAVTAVGGEPGYIALTPDGNYALVLNRRSGDMAVIHAGPRKSRRPVDLLTIVPVGSRPVSAALMAV